MHQEKRCKGVFLTMLEEQIGCGMRKIVVTSDPDKGSKAKENGTILRPQLGCADIPVSESE